MKKLLLCLSIALLLVSGPSFAQNISGKITTQDPTVSVADQEVFLKIYKKGKQVAGSKTKTNALGAYTFDVKEFIDSGFFKVSVAFDQAKFDSEFFVFSPKPVPDIAISRTTGASSDMRISEVIFFEFDTSTLAKIIHQIEIENQGALTYHPGRTDAQPVSITLLDGGFNLSLDGGITREQITVNEETDTLSIDAAITPKKKLIFNFSYMYPLDHATIEYKTAFGSLYNRLHLVFNKKAIWTSASSAQALEIPETLQTKFSKGYEISLPAQDISIKLRGLLRPKDKMILGMLIALLILIVGFIWVFLTTKPTKQISTQDLRKKIKDLSNDAQENSSNEHMATLEMLKRRLYHRTFDSK